METGLEIAIIGIACRLPGAKDTRELWHQLIMGVESISFLSDEELEESGVAAEDIQNPNYIKAKGVLEGIEYFDAFFFDYSARMADMMHPQVRIFHECAFNALEDAGYDPLSFRGLIGVYGGAFNSYSWQNLLLAAGKGDPYRYMDEELVSGKDILTTRVSHRLNLRGPSISINTQCSTSLVAFHLACQGLLSWECDMALAGASSIVLPPKAGYLYQDTLVLAPDGHCKPFAASANGTVPGDGAAVVILKRLQEALEDDDHIYAVYKGSAVNNDGKEKSDFAGPSVEGQAAVIRGALRMAEVEPESISYIEAHGTGTFIGDPIEIEALKRAFNTSKKGSCKIGSIKSNMGHLYLTAGIAGLIKTALALTHRLIPPTLNVDIPNPTIDFENSPFILAAELSQWKDDKYPLRAGISSFGMGGTNVHVILEEAPKGEEFPEDQGRQSKIITISAKTESALERNTANLREFFIQNPSTPLTGAAYTLHRGRRAFPYRRFLVGKSMEEVVKGLSSGSGNMNSFITQPGDRPVILMFPGGGAQYVNMTLGIYHTEPVFREEVDRCFEILKPLMGYDLKPVLYPGVSPGGKEKQEASPGNRINQTEIALPVIFTVEYALAKLLMHWGVNPYAMTGHSIGEYTAAALSGVFALEDALAVVAARAKLIQQTPGGSMLSVALPLEELNPLLTGELELASVNSSSLCVVSGSPEAIEDFARHLEELGVDSTRIHITHAGHSRRMEPILNSFEEIMRNTRLNKPGIPFISNVTGDWITVEEATDPGYWVKQLRQTVRFAEGLTQLLEIQNAIFVEVGPGKTLSTFARKHKDRKDHHLVANLVRHPHEEVDDDYFLLNELGQLWAWGVKIDWSAFYRGEKRKRLSLPGYSFDKKRYWTERRPFKITREMLNAQPAVTRKQDPAEWFYIPSWRRSALPVNNEAGGTCPAPVNWLLFCDEEGLGERLADKLQEMTGEEIRVARVLGSGAGSDFTVGDDRDYTIDPGQEQHYKLLLEDLAHKGLLPQKAVHLWCVNRDRGKVLDLKVIEETKNKGFYSLLYLARAVGNREDLGKLDISVVTNNMQQVTGEEDLCPAKALLNGPVRIIPMEYPDLSCRSIDIVLPEPGDDREEELINQLFREFGGKSPDVVTAYRGQYRWVEDFEPLRLEGSMNRDHNAVNPRLKPGGVYLITGGLGGIGLEIAEYLASHARAKVVLTGRSSFPARERWDLLLSSDRTDSAEAGTDLSEPTRAKILKLKQIEEKGGEIMVFSADTANDRQMLAVVKETRERFGSLNGIIHCAGLLDGAMIHLRTREMTENIMAPKVTGIGVLEWVLEETGAWSTLDFLVLCSSLASLLPMFGLVGHSAANAFLDAYACYNKRKGRPFTVSINWNSWKDVGRFARALKDTPEKLNFLSKDSISAAEGVETFHRVLAEDKPQVAVSTIDLRALTGFVKTLRTREASLVETYDEGTVAGVSQHRPQLSTSYTAPRTRVEEKLAALWQEHLGFKQIGVHDDFFQLGGDSLTAVKLLNKIRQTLQLKISLKDIFLYPTIEGMAGMIDAQPGGAGAEGGVYQPIRLTEDKEYYPLAPVQKGIYLPQQLYPSNTSYNHQYRVEIGVKPDKERLEATFQEIIKRYELFRTSFREVNGKPVQYIMPADKVKVEAAVYEMEDGEQWHLEIMKTFVRPFDLAQPPLFRVGIVKTGKPQGLLLMDIHHIIIDGFSMARLIREVAALYQGETLPVPKLRYKDYSEWKNSREERDRVKEQEKYWLKEFSGSIPVMSMSTDYPRPRLPEFQGKTGTFLVEKEETQKLKQLAKEEGVTLYAVVFALFNIYMSRICSQEDIIVGTIAVGRDHPDLEPLMGMLVNTLPIRNFPSGEKTFTGFLKEVRDRTVAAFENQSYPFEDLVQKLLVTRDRSRHPLFDVMFYFELESQYGRDNSLMDIRYGFDNPTAKFDQNVFIKETAGGLEINLEYRTKLFKEETIDRFFRYFMDIIAAVTGNKNIKLKDIKLSHGLVAAKPGELQADFSF